MSTTARVPTSPTPAGLSVYDGYATIRSRGLYRQRSIRAASLENANDEDNADSQRQSPARQEFVAGRGRRRTLSLKSNFSQSSNSSLGALTEDLYASGRNLAKPVRTPTVNDLDPVYAAANVGFRPLSDSSSSSGAGSNVTGFQDSVIDSTGSSSINAAEYLSNRKNFRFSLDSLHSSATPKTPDCEATAEEDESENIFLYTAPKSPLRLVESRLSHSYAESPVHPTYNLVPRNSFEMNEVHDFNGTPKSSLRRGLERSPSTASTNYRRTQSLVNNGQATTLMSNSYHYGDTSDNHHTQTARQLSSPPLAPVRRESLYASPARLMITPPPSVRSTSRSSLSPLENSPRIVYSQTQTQTAFANSQRCASAEILERTQTSQSLATIDQDEILTVPTAMPMLKNPVDKRYHTLGHMRVQSLGASLHRSYDYISFSYNFPNSRYPTDLRTKNTNKSAGNIYASADEAIADLNRLAPEYVDPLDFKIGCQTTLRSKPIIPWYELAIRRDLKRQSCPPISVNPENNCENLPPTASSESHGRQVNIPQISL